ncbi:MAG: uracil-DNA glycosylase family protein, partial [Candidatus Aenigmatarchaeota archaeon]
DRPPTDAEMAACAPLLKREILRVKPRLIVLLGATALRALVGPEEKLARVHGHVLKREKLRFLPTYHPAAAMRNRKIRAKFVEDMRRAAKF